MADLAGEDLEAVADELVGSGDAQAGEHHAGLAAALFTGQQHLGAGGALGEGQHAVLLHDEGLAQGHHEDDAQDAAHQGNQSQRHHAGHVDDAVLGPQEQGRQGENSACGHGLTGGADGLDQVVLQNGIPAQDHPDDTHGDHGCGDGCGNGHTYLQTQVGVGRAEHDGQHDADEDGRHRKFRYHTVCRYVRLKVAVFVGHSKNPFYFFFCYLLTKRLEYFIIS